VIGPVHRLQRHSRPTSLTTCLRASAAPQKRRYIQDFEAAKPAKAAKAAKEGEERSATLATPPLRRRRVTRLNVRHPVACHCRAGRDAGLVGRGGGTVRRDCGSQPPIYRVAGTDRRYLQHSAGLQSKHLPTHDSPPRAAAFCFFGLFRFSAPLPVPETCASALMPTMAVVDRRTGAPERWTPWCSPMV
jgi:hypothetical protein